MTPRVRRAARALLAAGTTALLMACGDLLPPVAVDLVPEGEGSLFPPAPPPTEPPTAPPTEPPAPAVDAAEPPPEPAVDAGAIGPVDPEPPPAPPTEPAVRPRRRMDIDQLDRAIRRVTRGIGWTEMRNNVEVNLFVDLAATLGKADFIQVTADNLETSAIFQKFLGDAARSVCARRLAADQATLDPAARVILPADPIDVDDVRLDTQLIALRSIFHGEPTAADSPTLASWRWLYQSELHVSRDPLRAWNGVCVALFTHPDFYTY
jgi:hypothetical protein